MALRRMFSLKVIDTDMFLEMPLSTQAVYMHLAMRADDDGFIDSPKRLLRMIGGCDDDLTNLIGKQFIIPFESGVCVVRHWRIHNYVRSDRYTPTMYHYEKNMLDSDTNGSYTVSVPGDDREKTPDVIPDVIPDGNQRSYQRDTQVRLGKDRIGKDKGNKPLCASNQSKDLENQDKKVKIKPPKLSEAELLVEFADWWEGYPKKRGKAIARKSWLKLRKTLSKEELFRSRDNYIAERQGRDPRYTMGGASFLGPEKAGWEDFLNWKSPEVQAKEEAKQKFDSLFSDKASVDAEVVQQGPEPRSFRKDFQGGLFDGDEKTD